MNRRVAQRTRRTVLGAAVAGAPAALLAACGQGAPAPTGQSSAPVTVTMWHIWDTTRVEPFHRSLQMLTEQRPNIRIDPTVMAVAPDREKEQKITAVIASGDPPDLLMVNQGIFASVAGAGSIVPLDDVLKRERIRPDEWYEGAYTSSLWNKKLYGLPAVNSGPRLLFSSKAFLREAGLDPEKPPQTWEALQQASRQMTRRQGEQFERTGWQPAAGTFEWLIFGLNGRIFSADGKKVAFGGTEGQQTIEYLTDFVWSIYDGPARLTAGGGGGAFQQGTSKAGFNVSGPFQVTQILEGAPQFEFGVAPFPRPARGKLADQLFVNWIYATPTVSSRRDASWAVAEWAGHGEGHRWFMLDQKRPGVIKKYNDDPAYPRINPHWKVINEILDRYTVQDQVVPGRGAVIAAMVNQLNLVFRREISVRDGLTNAVRDAQQELDTAWSQIGSAR
jgi:ABC-type glycerol-3-phosphate transport system substrate-binding protein